MQALPQQFRDVVYYAEVQGLRYKEIAAIRKIPTGAAMTRLHRGRQRLRTPSATTPPGLSQSQCRPPDNAESEVQQNGRRRLKDIGTLILRGLAVAMLSGAVGVAAAILVHPPNRRQPVVRT
jgi:hypothetical protein